MRFLTRRVQQPASASERIESGDVSLENYRAVADLTQKEYANENDRTKTLDSKAGPLIGATGAAIAFIIGAVVKPPDIFANRSDALTLGYYGAIALALILLLVAQVLFLWSARVRREYRRVEVSAWVDFSVMKLPSWQFYARLAGTYEAAIEANTVLNDKKARYQTAGIVLLLGGVVALLFVPGVVMASLWSSAHGGCVVCM